MILIGSFPFNLFSKEIGALESSTSMTMRVRKRASKSDGLIKHLTKRAWIITFLRGTTPTTLRTHPGSPWSISLLNWWHVTMWLESSHFGPGAKNQLRDKEERPMSWLGHFHSLQEAFQCSQNLKIVNTSAWALIEQRQRHSCSHISSTYSQQLI